MAYTGVSQDQNNTPFIPYGELGDTARLEAASLLQRVNKDVSRGVSIAGSFGIILSGLERDTQLAEVLAERVKVEDSCEITSLMELLVQENPREAALLIEQFVYDKSIVDVLESLLRDVEINSQLAEVLIENIEVQATGEATTLLELLIEEDPLVAARFVGHFTHTDKESLLQTKNYGAKLANKLLKADDVAFGISWLNNKNVRGGVTNLRIMLDVTEGDLAKNVVETLFDGVSPEVTIKVLSDQRLLPTKEGEGWPISLSEFVRLYQYVFRDYIAYKMPTEVLERVFFPDGLLLKGMGPNWVRVPDASMFVLVTFGDGKVPSELDFARGFKRLLRSHDPRSAQALFNAYPIKLRKRMELVGYYSN